MLVGIMMVLVAGCGSVQLNKTQEDSLSRQAKEVFGETADYTLLVIPSHGGLADSVFVAQSATQGPSALAREIAGYFEPAKTKSVEIAIAGPNPAKNLRIIKDAFSLHRGAKLPYLKLLFFGTPEQGRQVEELVRSYGAAYYFREYSAQ
jgi:hypothetical protein